jgi:dipeptidyl-peptidase-4
VCSRDQQTIVVLRASATDGTTTEISRQTSTSWVDLIPGTPALTHDGHLVIVDDRDGVKRLIVDGNAVTPLNLNVRSVVSVANEAVVFMANEIAHPEALSAWKWTSDSLTPLTSLDGMHSISLGGPTSVVRRASTSLTRATTTVTTTLHGSPSTHNIASFSEEALVRPNVQFIRAGAKQIPCALILPSDIKPGTKLPVLMDPYGGPHAQRVVDAYTAHCTSQWFADQGFAVLVVDGRGTPGLGTEWERAVYLDLATTVLEDQVDALRAVAADHPEMDLDRVAIRGWSFGGYLFRGSSLLCCHRGCSLRRSNWSCFFCCGTFLHDLGRLLCLCGRFAGCGLTCTTTENGVPIRCVLLVSSNSCNRHKITFQKCSPCGPFGLA